jgi:hypothetical protein
MPMLRRVAGLGLLAGALLVGGVAHTQEAADKGNPRVVKYAGLADVVLKNRGKVILVDLWHVG